MAAEAKRSSKTEVLSMRMDPRTRFLLDVLTRLRGQSISTVVERAILESADNGHFGHEGRNTWRDIWHINEGIRFLRMAAQRDLFPTYEDEYQLDFAKTHWPFFYVSAQCKDCREAYIEILWPKLDQFIDLWSKTKATDYFAAGKAMQAAISAAGVKPPDWPVKVVAEAKSDKAKSGSSGGWDAPKGGDLDDEIPF